MGGVGTVPDEELQYRTTMGGVGTVPDEICTVLVLDEEQLLLRLYPLDLPEIPPKKKDRIYSFTGICD
jgi:hypothetical protein